MFQALCHAGYINTKNETIPTHKYFIKYLSYARRKKCKEEKQKDSLFPPKDYILIRKNGTFIDKYRRQAVPTQCSFKLLGDRQIYQ